MALEWVDRDPQKNYVEELLTAVDATRAYEGCMAVVEVFDSSTYRVGWDPLAASSTTWRSNP